MQRAARYPNDAVAALHARYGDAFRFGFGPIRYTWFVGPAAARALLLDERGAFEQRRAYVFLRPVGGPEALIASEGAAHDARRRSVQPAFHPRHHAAWTARALAAFRAFARARRGGAPFDLHAEGRTLLLELVSDILLGPSLRRDHPGLLRDLETLMGFTNLPMAAQLLRVPLPGTPWARFAAARRRVDRIVAAVLAAPAPADADDGAEIGALGAALGGIRTHPEGGRVRRDAAVGLIAAAFDTSAAALAWSVQMALEHEGAAEIVRREVAAVGPERAASARAAPRLAAFVQETLRLFPPASAILRQARRPVTVAGVRLRAGERVALSVYLTHRDERRWREPLAFRPERWDGAAPDPFLYLPFGYGARHCVGAPLARALVATGLAVLLGEERLAGVRSERPAEWGTTLQPRGGVPVRLLRA